MISREELIRKNSKETENANSTESNDTVKYIIPGAIVAFGFFIGGNLTQGIYAGILTAAGFWILVEKLRTFYPSAYNWLLDHSVEADFVVSGMAALVLGFSVTGIIAAAVVNLLVSMILDNYRMNTGKVKDIESANMASVIGFGIAKTKSTLTSIKEAVKENTQSLKIQKEALAC